MTSSLVKAAPPSEGVKHPQNGAAVCYLEDPPGVGSTRGEGRLSDATVSAAIRGRRISTKALRKMVLALSSAPALPGLDDLVGSRIATQDAIQGGDDAVATF